MDSLLLNTAYEIMNRYEDKFLCSDDWSPVGPHFHESEEWKQMHAALTELARENGIPYTELAHLMNKERR